MKLRLKWSLPLKHEKCKLKYGIYGVKFDCRFTNQSLKTAAFF